MAFFDLKYMHTYRTVGVGGMNGNRYHFVKGKPVQVTDPSDINKFRGDSNVFLELDDNMKPVVPAHELNRQRSVKRFREQNLPENNQDLLQFVHGEPDQYPEPRNIGNLLDQAAEDTFLFSNQDSKKPEDRKEIKPEGEQVPGENLGTITTKNVTELPSEEEQQLVRKTKRVQPNQCPKCNRKFKTKTDLDIHLEDHDMD